MAVFHRAWEAEPRDKETQPLEALERASGAPSSSPKASGVINSSLTLKAHVRVDVVRRRNPWAHLRTGRQKLGVSPQAVRQKAIRGRWPRTKGNHGQARDAESRWHRCNVNSCGIGDNCQ